MSKHPTEVDIVFVGGGVSACVAAGRLAATNPSLEILIIEQGPNNFQDPNVITPGLFGRHLAPDAQTVQFWKANQSASLNGREAVLTTVNLVFVMDEGGMLGGGSSVNLLVYSRPVTSDFDDWNVTGWESNELIPLLKKVLFGHISIIFSFTILSVFQFENYHVAPGRATHGYGGPINVCYNNNEGTVGKEYLDVCGQSGIPVVEDIMDLHTGYGCSRIPQYVDPVTGYRQDAAHRYIHTQSSNKFLRFVTQTLVTRVLFDGTKAIGVEIIGNRRQDPDADQVPKVILARRLVVVSAGTIGSATILQRSGIGAPIQLAQCGVNTVVDLPGVGANYEDHCSLSQEVMFIFADVRAHVWGYKKSREFARRMPSYRGEFAPFHPRFSEESAAACVRLDAPLPPDSRDIAYTPEDNRVIEEYVRQHVGTGLHPIGTVRMAARDNGGCVDTRLNVYGTENLKVADLSIIPGNVGGNTYATALLVGEKAAILIAEDLGLTPA
ncbi:unnamed protein product [Rhizoctonia solani]|uniref:Alcohol oxidase n=1 Tax=Rhizoctonia solani TaxID=456999 RepID=A0A8H3CLB7_9AGAM|nr:unnamed protein product [Rhizoctonia solani]